MTPRLRWPSGAIRSRWNAGAPPRARRRRARSAASAARRVVAPRAVSAPGGTRGTAFGRPLRVNRSKAEAGAEVAEEGLDRGVGGEFSGGCPRKLEDRHPRGE